MLHNGRSNTHNWKSYKTPFHWSGHKSTLQWAQNQPVSWITKNTWNIYSQHVYCYGNDAKYWVLFISCVTKWLIFQNLVTFALNEKWQEQKHYLVKLYPELSFDAPKCVVEYRKHITCNHNFSVLQTNNNNEPP